MLKSVQSEQEFFSNSATSVGWGVWHSVLKSFVFRAKTPANYILTTELLGKQHPKKLKSGKGRPFFLQGR